MNNSDKASHQSGGVGAGGGVGTDSGLSRESRGVAEARLAMSRLDQREESA